MSATPDFIINDVLDLAQYSGSRSRIFFSGIVPLVPDCGALTDWLSITPAVGLASRPPRHDPAAEPHRG